MIFRTELNISASSHKISYQKPLVFIGSCFSVNIGSKLSQDKFQTLINPFGTLYNPHSISKNLINSLKSNEVLHDYVLTNDGLYKHYDYHGEVYANSPNELQNKILIQQDRVKDFLSRASHVFITLGTAYVFERQTDQKIVANCHKQPAKLFNRRLLTIAEIEKDLNTMVESVSMINPAIQIILTVSPIRHLRDGMIENNKSKALLITACHQVVESMKHLSYFPSYELIMDDLRDYRYYESDLLHPNAVAIDYVYEKFQQCYFSDETVNLQKEILSLIKATQHRPFNKRSDKHQIFLKKTLAKLNTNAQLYSIDWSKEIAQLSDDILG